MNTKVSSTEKYQDVFSPGYGTIKGYKATMVLKDDAVPVFCRAHPVPYALREAVEKQLIRLEEAGDFGSSTAQ